MIVYFLIVISLTSTLACFSRTAPPPQDLIHPGQWNHDQNERIVDSTCECGQHQHNETRRDPPWNLYISHSKPFNFTETVCVGTIITSNLIATVLECVLLENATLNVYHMWMENPVGIINKSDLIVSTISFGEGERFEVEEIIIHSATLQHIHLSKKTKKKVHNDLVLLKVNVVGRDFLGNSRLEPICIPTVSTIDFIGRLATYFGTGLGEHASLFNYDFHYGIINSNRVCENHTDESENDGPNEPFLSLCVRWGMTEIMSQDFIKGGSLFVESIKDGRAFLAGINCGIEKNYEWSWPSNEITHFMLAQFTNILPFIKYIEHIANQHGSKWCDIKTGLVLPEKVAHINYAQLPFEGEPSEGMGKKSWWCVEHENIMGRTTKTDWSRYADGENVVRNELYKCNENLTDKNIIQFFQKGKAEPIGQGSLHEMLRYSCAEIPKELVPITDYIFSTECIFLQEECGKKDNQYRIRLNAGEKLSLEWFGLVGQLGAYKRCISHDSSITFYTSDSHQLSSFASYELCACNNLNSTGIPSKVSNSDTCLELYSEKYCRGWIRTIPAGNTFHSENLMSDGKISYKQAKSFHRCSLYPNCYQLDVSVFQVVFKNKGIKIIDDLNIQFKEYPIIPTKAIAHSKADGEKAYQLERDLSGFRSVIRIKLAKGITKRADNYPELVFEDFGYSAIPFYSWRRLNQMFRNAYDYYLHQEGTQPEDYVRDFFPFNEYNSRKFKYLTLTLKGDVSASVYEYVNVAKDFEFSYDLVVRIRGRVASGESLTGEMLKEKIANDLGFKEDENCKGLNKKFCYWGDASVLVRRDDDLKLIMTVVDPVKRDKNKCVRDEAKCPNGISYSDCSCNFNDNGWNIDWYS